MLGSRASMKGSGSKSAGTVRSSEQDETTDIKTYLFWSFHLTIQNSLMSEWE